VNQFLARVSNSLNSLIWHSRKRSTEAETSVLFELISHRYERRSLRVTANQPFSQWDSIFTDSMMTVAAIDRLVHHATIIELKAESFRKQSAISRTNSQ
jgi:DNA replication protein DnaC